MNNLVLRTLRKVSPLYSRRYSYKPIKRPDFRSLQNVESTQIKNTGSVDSNEISLSKLIRAKIETTGPISVSDYMRQVLTNPSEGYYMNRDVFGSRGDFITSPEINQIFGELIAIWCLLEWQKCGSPAQLQLVELGPGRGTLMQDVFRVFSKFQIKNYSVHLVEISPYLSSIQAQRLCYISSEVKDRDYYRVGETLSGVKMYWHRKIEDVPKEFSIVLAHEFFDALPIRKFQKVDGVWKEILVDIDPASPDAFRYILSRSQTPMSTIFGKIVDPSEKRDHIEMCFDSQLIVKQLAQRFEEYGGFGLIMDYGHTGEKSDTFRSFKNHKLHDPLVDPGTADLTADVDFSQLKKDFESDNKCITFGPIAQNKFLLNMEAKERLKALLEASQSEEQQELLKSGFDMLANPDKMGDRFKFLAIFPEVLKEILQKNPVTAFI